MARWACVVLHLSLTVALVPPVARPPSHVVCSGAAYDYCIQSLGCTGEEAAKAEGKLLPRTAERLNRTKIDYVCNWLQSEFDLSDAELKKVMLRRPTLLARTKTSMALKQEWFESELGVSMKELKKMVLTNPVFLDLSVEANLAPRIEWLRSRLDLNSNEVKRFSLKSPAWFSLSIEENMEPTLDWLQTRLDLDDGGLKKVVLVRPTLLGLSVEDNLAPRLDWLQRRLDLDDAQLKKVVLTNPSVLTYSVKDNLAPTLERVQTLLDLNDAELKKMVLALPSLLGYSVEDNLAPKLEWLRKRLDLDDARLRKLVLGRPQLLGLSVEDNLAPTLDWLQTRLGLSDAELKKMVLYFPQMLPRSVEAALEPKLDWLQKRLDLDESGLRKMVLALPSLLGYSVEANMEPKLCFFEEELGLSPSEVRASIISTPARLGYSLKTRYRPRFEVCRAAGADPEIVLSSAMKTDQQFCKRVGVPLEALREASGAPSMSPAAAVPSKLQRWHQLKVPSSWALAELRPWQLEVNEMIQEPTNNTGIWLFDSQTYPGRGKGTFFKHLIATTDDVFYEGTPSSCNVEAEKIQVVIDRTRDVSKQTRAMCYRLPRADPHNACFYEVLGAVAPETHIVVAGSFWPDLRLLPNRRWRLFEWDDENNIHELPPGTDPGGRVGVGNTNSEGDYIPYWNREPL